MDACTRPPPISRQTQRHILAGLAAITIAVLPVLAATSENEITSSVTPVLETGGEATAITPVNAGEEGLELSARFSREGRALAKDIAWTVKNNSGDIVYNDVASVADMKLPPGSYQISARYGSAMVSDGVNLSDGVKLGVNLVLNAGGLRLLPRIENLSTAGLGSTVKVFSNSGTNAGELVASSHRPGEILKVAAGDYRVESRFDDGNAMAVTDVHVKAGIMSSLDVNHKAGLAHFTSPGKDDVTWQISGTAAKLEMTGADTVAVLIPGNYQATLNGKTQNFTVSASQTTEVTLP